MFFEFLGDTFKERFRNFTGNCNHQYRKLGQVDFEDLRIIFQISGQVALSLVDLVAHPLNGVVDIDFGNKLDGNHRGTLGAHRANLFYVFQAA